MRQADAEPLALIARMITASVVEHDLDAALEALLVVSEAEAAAILIGDGAPGACTERWHGFDGALRDRVRPLLLEDRAAGLRELQLDGPAGGRSPRLFISGLGPGARGAAALAFDSADRDRPGRRAAADHVLAILAARLADERRLSAMRAELSKAKRWFEITGTQLKLLDRERQKFAAVVSQADTFVLVVDCEGVVSWANGALRELIARGDESVRVGDLRVEQVWDRLGIAIAPAGCPAARVLREGKLTHLESRRREAGEEQALYLTLLPIKDVRGVPAEVLIMIQDLSGLDLLRRSEARYRLLFECSPDAMVMCAPGSGEILLANPAACQLTGYTAGELAKLILEDLHTPEGWGRAREAYERIVSRDSRDRTEQRLRTCGGQTIVANVTAARFDLDGRPVTLLVLQDVTKQLQLEAELQHAQKMEIVGRLAAGITHELNNIMTVVLAEADMLAARAGGDPELRQIAETTEQAAVRAALLTRKLLTFSRKEVVQTEVLDLAEVMRTIEGLLRNLLGERITLHLELGAAPCLVRGDRSQLEEIAINLAANARDAIMGSGNFWLGVTCRAAAGPGAGGALAGEVILTGRDDGLGMDEATRDRVFEPFFTTKATHAGTGLGMSTIARVVARHGGTIALESAPATGTLVRIVLPRAEAPAWTPPPLEAPAVVTRGEERILVVDDEADVRRTAGRLLEHMGYGVQVVASAAEALALLEAAGEPFALLLTDVVMPQMSGGELSTIVRRRFPGVAVVFMSGYADEEIVRAGVTNDQAVFVRKPFDGRSLSQAVRKALARQRSDRGR